MLEEAEKGKTVMKKTNDVSKLVGVSKRTLQYYDDLGLITVERSRTNHRLYDQQAMEKLWQILIYKEMDFELEEIKQLLPLSKSQKQQYLEQKKEDINEQIVRQRIQIAFISLVQHEGMPSKPDDDSDQTYVSHINKMKNQLQKVICGETSA